MQLESLQGMKSTLPLAGGSDVDHRYAAVPSAGEALNVDHANNQREITLPSPELRLRLSQRESDELIVAGTLPG